MLIDRKDRYMFLKLICVISMTVAFFNTIALILYKRQVKSICRQIRFLNENNSNLEITKDIGSKEIDELVDTLNDFLENFKNEKIKINEKDLKLREIVTNISHDIRTPLTSLNGYFELLGQAEDEKESLQCTESGILPMHMAFKRHRQAEEAGGSQQLCREG